MLNRDNIFKFRNYDMDSNFDEFNNFGSEYITNQFDTIEMNFDLQFDSHPQEFSNLPEHKNELKGLHENLEGNSIISKEHKIYEPKNRKSSISKAAEEHINKNLPRGKGIYGCRHCGGDGFVRFSDGVRICQECIKITGNCLTCLETGYKINSTLPCHHRKT